MKIFSNSQPTSFITRVSIVIISIITIGVFIATSIQEVSARGRGGGRSFSGGGRSFSGGGRSGSGSLRYSGGSRNRSSFGRSNTQQWNTGQRNRTQQQPAYGNNPRNDRQTPYDRSNHKGNQNLGDRQDSRNDNREDWQDHQNQNREDWQNYSNNRQNERQEYAEDHYYRGGYRYGYGGAAVVGAAVGAAIVIGSTVNTVPAGYTVYVYGGTTYYVADGVYYQPVYRNGATVYVVVNKPY